MTAEEEFAMILDWRVDRLRDLGVDEVLAWDAAWLDVDWHEVETLVAAGCPAATAVEIVA